MTPIPLPSLSYDKKNRSRKLPLRIKVSPIPAGKSKARLNRLERTLEKNGLRPAPAGTKGFLVPEDHLWFRVQQIKRCKNKSLNGSLSALGLGHREKSREHKWTRQEWGNIKQVQHLIDVVLIDQKSRKFFTANQSHVIPSGEDFANLDRKMLVDVISHGLKSFTKEGSTMEQNVGQLINTAERFIEKQKIGNLSDWERHAASIVVDRAFNLMKDSLPNSTKGQIANLIVKMAVVEGITTMPTKNENFAQKLSEIAKKHSAKYLIYSELKKINDKLGERYQLVVSFSNQLTDVFNSGDVVELEGPKNGTKFNVQVFGKDTAPDETEVKWVFNGSYSQHAVDITPKSKDSFVKVIYHVDGCDIGCEKLAYI